MAGAKKVQVGLLCLSCLLYDTEIQGILRKLPEFIKTCGILRKLAEYDLESSLRNLKLAETTGIHLVSNNQELTQFSLLYEHHIST